MFRQYVPLLCGALTISMLDVAVATLGATGFGTSKVVAAFPIEFSAEAVLNSGSETIPFALLYVNAGNIRWDVKSGGTRALISVEKSDMWTLFLDSKIAVHSGTDVLSTSKKPVGMLDTTGPYDIANPCSQFPRTSCTRVGPDLVSGRTCTKWAVAKIVNDAPKQSTFCIDETLHFPLYVIDDSGRIELTNISEKPQPEGLFQIPIDFQKGEAK